MTAGPSFTTTPMMGTTFKPDIVEVYICLPCFSPLPVRNIVA